MLPIFSIAYWLFTIVTLPVLFLVALVVFVLTWPFDRRLLVFHLFSCWWGSFYIYMNPIWHTQVVGRGRLPWRGPAVMVANHASLVDIPALYGLYRPFKWVAKASLFKVPVVGWNMWLNGYVAIERGAHESIRSMMERCQKLLAQGSPILLFPEGTRTATGELQPFKDGAFKLALAVGCPLFPIAVKGTFDTLPKHGIVFRRRMDARVEVLEPLDPAKFDSVDALRDAARTTIASALAKQ